MIIYKNIIIIIPALQRMNWNDSGIIMRTNTSCFSGNFKINFKIKKNKINLEDFPVDSNTKEKVSILWEETWNFHFLSITL